jgi:quercetin dioxygenase-like cupin family protein
MSMQALVDAIADRYRAAPPAAYRDTLVRAAAALASSHLRETVNPGSPQLPVCRHLDAAVRLGLTGPCATIATALSNATAQCRWLQNANYLACPPASGFLDNYGYVELLGPGRALDSQIFRVGMLLLGPQTDYPEHAHPAEEVYHVISGSALWSRRGAPWQAQAPGAAIHHPPHMVHATQTGDEPLLALYCWSGDIHAAARLVPVARP